MQSTRQRRTRRSGAVYRRASDGLWVGAVSITVGRERRRKTFASKDREVAQAKLDAWLAVNRPDAPPPDAPLTKPIDRYRAVQRAREIATHTDTEWAAKRKAANGLCHYCQRSVGPNGGEPDHVVPVGRGGSDGIDNIVLACTDCNRAKSVTPVDEFREWAERTGFFTKPRRWETQ